MKETRLRKYRILVGAIGFCLVFASAFWIRSLSQSEAPPIPLILDSKTDLSPNGSPLPEASLVSSPQLENMSSANHTLEPMGNSLEGKLPDVVIPELVPLAYTPLQNTQTVEPLAAEEIHKILKETKVLGGSAFFYEKTGDENEVYAGFRSENQQWKLGPAAGWVYRGNADTVVGEVVMYGERLLRYAGAFGAAYVQENYFTIQAGKPVPYLRVDTGMYGWPSDLDGDGIPELVTTVSMTSTIYKRMGNHFVTMDVSQAFGGTPVMWQGGKRFLLQPINGTSQAYEYTSKGFKLLP